MLQFVQDHAPYFVFETILLLATLISVILSDGTRLMAGPPPD